LVSKSKAKRPLGRHNGRWDANIKINVKELGCEAVD
jgi:hypothetical protein